MKSKTKKIILIVTLIIIIILIGGTFIMQKILKDKKPVEIDDGIEYRKGAPEHFLFYLESTELADSSVNIYNEKGEKINNYKIDLVSMKVNEIVEPQVFTQDSVLTKPTNLSKISSRLYALYENKIIVFSKTSKTKMVTLPEEIITSYETIEGRNEIVYLDSEGYLYHKDLATNEKAMLNNYIPAEIEALSNDTKYNSDQVTAAKNGKKEVLKFQADKDGVYYVVNQLNKEKTLYRYLFDKKIFKNIAEQEKIRDFAKVDDWIYYISDTDGFLYRIFKDGTQKTKIAEDVIDFKGYNDFKGNNAKDYIFGMIDTVYYINKENKLVKVIVKNNESEVVLEDVEHVNYNYLYVYYTKTSEDGLFVMNTQDKNSVKISDKKIKNYVVTNTDLPN